MFQPAPTQSSNFGAISTDQNLIENPALMYLATLGSKDSYRCMKSKLNKFARFFGYKGLVDCDWKSMQPNHVTVFLAAQSWGSARTYNCYLSALKSVALNAWRNKQIDLDHFQRIKSLKQRRVFRAPSGRAISSEESASLIKSLEANSLRTVRNRAIFYLMLGCGLRRAEVCELRVKQVSFKNRAAKIIGKGNKERTIYLNKACVQAIKDYLNVRPKEGIKTDKFNSKKALFLSERKERISRRTVQYIVDKELTAAGLDTKKYSTHKLRHTAATLMYQYGNVDIRALQEVLGHESISTTEIYTHVANEQARNAIENNPLANI